MPDFGTVATALGVSGGWLAAIAIVGFTLYLMLNGKLVPSRTIERAIKQLDEAVTRTEEERDYWQRNAIKYRDENRLLREAALTLGTKAIEAIPLVVEEMGGTPSVIVPPKAQ